MKLNREFLIHNTNGQVVLVPTGAAGFSGVVRGNRTLGALLELLASDTTEAELVSAMKARFTAPDGMIESDVQTALAQLRKIGALDE